MALAQNTAQEWREWDEDMLSLVLIHHLCWDAISDPEPKVLCLCPYPSTGDICWGGGGELSLVRNHSFSGAVPGPDLALFWAVIYGSEVCSYLRPGVCARYAHACGGCEKTQHDHHTSL